MIDPDHRDRVIERHTPRFVIAQWLSKSENPSAMRMKEADELIEVIVRAGYAIEPIEDEDET